MRRALMLLATVLPAACAPEATSPAGPAVDVGRVPRPTECQVHGLSLLDDVVDVVYGLPASNAQFEAARERDFPHAALIAFGGCVVMERSTAEVRFCLECRKAQIASEQALAAAGTPAPMDSAARELYRARRIDDEAVRPTR